MKKLTYLFILPFIISFFISCGYEKKEIAINLVFDNSLDEGKYPSYFKDFLMPFSEETCEKDILLKPINFVRADIKRTAVESNAWYFQDVGENTVEFSTNFLKQFFTDSLTNGYLTSKSKNKKLNLLSYIKEPSGPVIIFSEESELDEFEGKKVYHSSKSVRDEIIKMSCSNLEGTFTILINPNELLIEEGIGVGGTTNKNPCNQSTTSGALDINDAITEIIDTTKTLTERLNKAEEVWAKYCHPNAYVALFKNKDDESIDVWDPGSGKNYFTNRLAVLESIVSTSIFRIEKANDGRISGIHIIECQNANELL